jgi:hypothetical protein
MPIYLEPKLGTGSRIEPATAGKENPGLVNKVHQDW